MMDRIRSSALRLALAASLLPAVASCGDDPLGPQWPEDTNFASELGIDLSAMTKLDSGVYIQTIEEGEGVGIDVGEVTVSYILWLADGTQVDDGTFSFRFGFNEVVPGFEQGVSGMRVGEVRKIVIPSELGYGGQERQGIPAHSVLVFQVELLSGGEPA